MSNTYPVSGNLYALAEAQAPDDPDAPDDGKKGEAGSVRFRLASRPNFSKEPTACPCQSDGPKEYKLELEANDVEVEVLVQMIKTMPLWESEEDAKTNCPTAYEEGRRFINALDEHENGHVEIVRNFCASSKLKPFFSQVFAHTGCLPRDKVRATALDILEENVKEMNDKALKELRKLTDRFDEETNHGMGKSPEAGIGTVVDLGLNCPHWNP